MSELIHVPEVLAPPPAYPMLMTAGKATMIEREALRMLTTPNGTNTHKPIPHIDVVEALIETLGFRNLSIVEDRYALSPDGNKMFGVMMLSVAEGGVRLCLGLRNSHDKTFSLAVTVGFRVLVCANLSFSGEFTPLLRKHTKHADVRDILALGVEQAQRSFGPLMRRIDEAKEARITDDQARLAIYAAFVERSGIELPRHLAPIVHSAYFNPPFPDFEPRTRWSLENSFTHALKQLDPIPMLQATAKLGPFLASLS